jgi:hypothetical protein
MGYLLKWEEGGAKLILEADTVSCSHCQRVLPKKGWREQGGWCFGCGHPVCYRCLQSIPLAGCLPFKKKIDQAWDKLHHRGF